jgi:signal transduction histidine kinase
MMARLRESEARVVRSEKLALTGMLAARVAHDIRNPLSSIKMQVQLLRRRLGGLPDAKDPVAPLLRDIDQVDWVVRDLLELARPGELRTVSADVNDTIDEVLEQMLPQLTHRKIVVERRLRPGLQPVRVDVDRIKQALRNLVVNAAEAITTGGTLTVSSDMAEDGSSVTVEIQDDGAGIDPAIASRIFDPFVSTKREGVGLGLFNTRSIVERHGGTVDLVPRPDRGARARIVLPVDRRASAPTHVAQALQRS